MRELVLFESFAPYIDLDDFSMQDPAFMIHPIFQKTMWNLPDWKHMAPFPLNLGRPGYVIISSFCPSF